jgi:hypothetical protein
VSIPATSQFAAAMLGYSRPTFGSLRAISTARIPGARPGATVRATAPMISRREPNNTGSMLLISTSAPSP